jgi:hypothetical protein
MQEMEVGGSQSKAGLRQKQETLSEKQTKAKRADRVAQVVERLPDTSKTLSSNPVPQKKKK